MPEMIKDIWALNSQGFCLRFDEIFALSNGGNRALILRVLVLLFDKIRFTDNFGVFSECFLSWSRC